jgi:tryptophan-rich sensory protein
VIARRAKPVLTAAAAALLVATLGALITDLSPWYYDLRQPAWKPPDMLFGPVWTAIFSLTALSGIYAWNGAPARAPRVRMLWLFAFNLALNILWSALFFRFRRPDWALAEVGLLWLSIAGLIWFLAPYSKTAAWLLVPYLAWVAFAAALNLEVVKLNYPFAAA